MTIKFKIKTDNLGKNGIVILPAKKNRQKNLRRKSSQK